MKKSLANFHLSLNDRTSLLEAVDWNEDEFAKLEAYLYQTSQDFNLKHPSQILSVVKKHFGVEASNLLKEIFFRELSKIKTGETDET